MRQDGYNELHAEKTMVPSWMLEKIAGMTAEMLAREIAGELRGMQVERVTIESALWLATMLRHQAEVLEHDADKAGHIHVPARGVADDCSRSNCQHCGRDIRLNITGTSWTQDWEETA